MLLSDRDIRAELDRERIRLDGDKTAEARPHSEGGRPERLSP